jgi:DNA-binding CsgD family transcriptional regulator
MTKQYRKIAKYTKSSQKYMEERQRRREILSLYMKGFTQAQIGEKLDVSTRTVQRDWRKLHGYIEHLKWEQRKKIDELLSHSLDRVPESMRLPLLGYLMFADKRTKTRSFQALLAGDVAALRLMLRRRNNEG